MSKGKSSKSTLGGNMSLWLQEHERQLQGIQQNMLVVTELYNKLHLLLLASIQVTGGIFSGDEEIINSTDFTKKIEREMNIQIASSMFRQKAISQEIHAEYIQRLKAGENVILKAMPPIVEGGRPRFVIVNAAEEQQKQQEQLKEAS